MPHLLPSAPFRASALRLARLALLLGVLLSATAATQEYYVKPSGTTGNGTTPALAASFTHTNTINDLNNLLRVIPPTDLTVWFLPKEGPGEAEYVIDQPLLVIAGALPGVTPTRKIRLKGYVGPGTAYTNSPRPVLKLGTVQATSSWGVQTAHHWLIRTAQQTNAAPFSTEYLEHYLDYFELTNLTLDGNFDNQGAYTGPGNVGGYKSFALDVRARTGLIRDVLVRRFGSSGVLPHSYYDEAGTEAFPVRVGTYSHDKTPGDWNPSAGIYPWVMENVEVTDMRFLRGGYASLLMPFVRHTNGLTDLNAQPIIVVRRCQVRSHPQVIAFGTAATPTTLNGKTTNHPSQRIRFEDNVVLNSGIVLNTDTGNIGWITLSRNAFLDIVSGSSLGQWNTQANPTANHHNYRFEYNLYRFRGRMNVRDYHDYDEPATLPQVTEPNLPLGRLYGVQAAALVFQGRASQVTFANNWITTWPSGDFFHPSPGNPPDEHYRVVWVIKPNEKLDARIGNRGSPSAPHRHLADQPGVRDGLRIRTRQPRARQCQDQRHAGLYQWDHRHLRR